jgi:anti-sigma factor RsiW
MSEIRSGSEWECARARDWMAQNADGDLAPDQVERLTRHLDGCPECRRLMVEFTAIEGELSRLGRSLDSPNQPDARGRLARSLESPPPRRHAGWISAAAAIAAAVALIAIAPHPNPPRLHRAIEHFVTVPYLPPLDPRENATVVRMDIRVATLMAAGYRVSADPAALVPAEVLVGEDGRVHAVRLLQDLDWNGRGD